MNKKYCKVTIKDMIGVLVNKDFYYDLVIFSGVCIPIVLVILFFSIKIDQQLGWTPFMGSPYDIICFVFFWILGISIIWYSYSYLIIIGKGSPCPQLGGTKKFVRWGPYSVIRHPSVIGKLFGVLGLGCLSNSVFFTFIVIPVLFTGSVFYNRFIQEKVCVQRFGKLYLRYRQLVPMFIPKLRLK